MIIQGLCNLLPQPDPRQTMEFNKYLNNNYQALDSQEVLVNTSIWACGWCGAAIAFKMENKRLQDQLILSDWIQAHIWTLYFYWTFSSLINKPDLLQQGLFSAYFTYLKTITASRFFGCRQLKVELSFIVVLQNVRVGIQLRQSRFVCSHSSGAKIMSCSRSYK